MTFCTEEAGAVVGAPPQVADSDTRTLPGAMAPDGNPVPVTLTVVAPADPMLGLVSALSLTIVCAFSAPGSTNNARPRPSARPTGRLFMPRASTRNKMRSRPVASIIQEG